MPHDTSRVVSATTREYGNIPENTPLDVGMSQLQSLFVDEVSPQWMELARAGVLYGANNGSAVGLDNVIAIPTTTATYGLYNSNATKHLVVLKIAVMTTTVTAGTTMSLIAGLPATAQASAETKYASSLALPINTRQADPGGYLTDAVTLAATPLWQTLASYQGESGLLGGAATAWVNGMYIVPPSFCLGIDILASDGGGNTQLFDVDILWAELDMDLG